MDIQEDCIMFHISSGTEKKQQGEFTFSVRQQILRWATMATSGVAASPIKYCLQLPVQCPGLREKRVSVSNLGRSRSHCTVSTQKYHPRRMPLVKCAMEASFGGSTDDSAAIFPRINVKDPYKRLGINKEASEDEIQAARNFLIQRYAGHKPSVDAIEAAHDKIIMQKFYDRKNPKVDIKKKVREMKQSRVVQSVTSRFRTPATKFIVKTSIAFIVLGALTVLFPTEEGPTLQVAISLITAIYFIHDRLKNKLRAFLYGAVVGFYWVVVVVVVVVQSWCFYFLLASGDILDGVCGSSHI
uniref:Uncharacterized protein n=1 Tax=Solanum tuberosum TaxID=4113 RepID=M1AVJ3_SOLTU